ANRCRKIGRLCCRRDEPSAVAHADVDGPGSPVLASSVPARTVARVPAGRRRGPHRAPLERQGGTMRTVTPDGVGIAWAAHGPPESSPLILLHSLGASGGMWHPQREALQDRYRVIL